MSLLEAIFLGFIQGATEFLPVSSSGHLVLVPEIFNMANPDLTLVGIVHIGTLIAVFIYFWSDLLAISVAIWEGLRRRDPLGTAESRLGWLIAAGSIPAIVLGLTLQSVLEEVFSDPPMAAGFLLLTALFLVLGEKLMSGRKDTDCLTWTDAIIIGLFQAAALFPGISRSGSTIVGGLLRGLDRPTATRFSFLLGVPVILGAGLLSVYDVVTVEQIVYPAVTYVAAFVTAAVTGYACIHFLLQWVRSHSLYIFVVYCVLLSLGYLLYTFVLA